MIDIVVAINTASVAAQCHTRDAIERCLTDLVRCLIVLQSAFSARTAALIFDRAMEAATLGLDEPLLASLNHHRDRQIVRQWFLYTRNRAQSASKEFLDVRISSSEAQLDAQLPTDVVHTATHWISFSGVTAFKCGELHIAVKPAGNLRKVNAEKEGTVRRWLPRYESSPKHGAEEYLTKRGIASRMDLKDEEAQALLAQSIRHTDDVRFAVSRSVFYAFRLTRIDNGQGVFHGYIVESGEVPPTLLRLLK